MTGRPAPTELSWYTLAPDDSAAAKISCQSLYDPENAFLFGVTMLMPRDKTLGYWSATSCELVLSTRMTFEGAAARKSIVFANGRGSCVDSASLEEMPSYGRDAYWGLYRTFLLREMKMRDSLGDNGFVASRFETNSSCERKHLPTPPAPVLPPRSCKLVK